MDSRGIVPVLQMSVISQTTTFPTVPGIQPISALQSEDSFNIIKADLHALSSIFKADRKGWDDQLDEIHIRRLPPPVTPGADFLDTRGHVKPLPYLDARLLAFKNAQDLADRIAEANIATVSWLQPLPKTILPPTKATPHRQCTSLKLHTAIKRMENLTKSIILSLPYSHLVESSKPGDHQKLITIEEEDEILSIDCSSASTASSEDIPFYDGSFDFSSPRWSFHKDATYKSLQAIAKCARDGRDFLISKASSFGSALSTAEDIFPGGLIHESR
ncbi:hypothetical protein BJ138DRAFT_1148648 [Hygrophoropsis aurantiaca]|uniref:Uncharacterized protein n=1 Tax=Hygrophoropsis aurantiaca TaxID=72124 RepID=A0ACB8AHE4_9AGAM|nr:hypothetical protein BJ138DRAFT_1148648 [Hygrophoropsis aurantiaca]